MAKCFKQITLASGDKVPCNRCPNCIKRRVQGWSARLKVEEKICNSAWFITLTYDNNNLPVNLFGRGTLRKDDLQKFFKRVRKHSPTYVDAFGMRSSNIKYYAVGEYGGKSKRPHYHAIVFNAVPELMDQCWDKGGVYFGQVNGASIGYCLKYMCKPKSYRKECRSNIIAPEFSCMSKGIGISYLENEVNLRWHLEDIENRMYMITEQGHKISLPRYYKDKIFMRDEKRIIEEFYKVIADKEEQRRMERIVCSSKEFRNEMAAIDAAYDKLIHSSLKTKL